MIHSILIIDGESGISFIEYQNLPKTPSMQNFFQAINHIVDDIRQNIEEEHDNTEISRILMIESNAVLIHYFQKGRFLVCGLADADDNKNKILQILESLARRFWAKHQADIEQFRLYNKKDNFNSFIVDIETFTLKGVIAESFPKLIVSEATLDRLNRMSMINNVELSIAKLCQGKTSPLNIAQQIQRDHEEVNQMLKKLLTLDILKYEPNLASKG